MTHKRTTEWGVLLHRNTFGLCFQQMATHKLFMEFLQPKMRLYIIGFWSDEGMFHVTRLYSPTPPPPPLFSPPHLIFILISPLPPPFPPLFLPVSPASLSISLSFHPKPVFLTWQPRHQWTDDKLWLYEITKCWCYRQLIGYHFQFESHGSVNWFYSK